MKYYFIYLGRLGQLIHIPLPDEESRMAILKVSLRKSSVVNDVDMNYLVNVTKCFSGAYLTKICQRAYILVTRELMQQGQPIYPIIEIRHEHLKKAMIFTSSSNGTPVPFVSQGGFPGITEATQSVRI